MLHGEAALFISLHPEPPGSRDLECIRRMKVVTELTLGPLFQKKTTVFTSRKARKSGIGCAETRKNNISRKI